MGAFVMFRPYNEPEEGSATVSEQTLSLLSVVSPHSLSDPSAGRLQDSESEELQFSPRDSSSLPCSSVKVLSKLTDARSRLSSCIQRLHASPGGLLRSLRLPNLTPPGASAHEHEEVVPTRRALPSAIRQPRVPSHDDFVLAAWNGAHPFSTHLGASSLPCNATERQLRTQEVKHTRNAELAHLAHLRSGCSLLRWFLVCPWPFPPFWGS